MRHSYLRSPNSNSCMHYTCIRCIHYINYIRRSIYTKSTISIHILVYTISIGPIPNALLRIASCTTPNALLRIAGCPTYSKYPTPYNRVSYSECPTPYKWALPCIDTIRSPASYKNSTPVSAEQCKWQAIAMVRLYENKSLQNAFKRT